MNQHAAVGTTANPPPPPSPDTDHELVKLIAYCDGIQALADAVPDGTNVFEYLTPFSFRMLFEPLRVNLELIRGQLQ